MSRARRSTRQESSSGPGAVITLAEGVGKGLRFKVDRSEAEVEEARRSCASGAPNDVALSIVLAFLLHMGAPCSPEELADEAIWPPADVAALFDMLGMPLMEWTSAEDAELTQLLTEGGERG